MATIQKRKYLNKTSYQVRIRRLGIKTITKSFMNRTDAKRWARNIETKLDRGDYSDYSTASKVYTGFQSGNNCFVQHPYGDKSDNHL